MAKVLSRKNEQKPISFGVQKNPENNLLFSLIDPKKKKKGNTFLRKFLGQTPV